MSSALKPTECKPTESRAEMLWFREYSANNHARDQLVICEVNSAEKDPQHVPGCVYVAKEKQ